MAMEYSPLYRKVIRAPNAVFFSKRPVFYRLFPVDYPPNTQRRRVDPHLPYLINYPKREVFYDLTVYFFDVFAYI